MYKLIPLKRYTDCLYLSDGEVFYKANKRPVTTAANKRGYLCVMTDKGYEFLYHRAKFVLTHGYTPPEVDHIDQDITNNDIGNLRAATASQNQVNTDKVNAVSGIKNVRLKPNGRYQTNMSALGYTETQKSSEEAALAADLIMKAVYGDFARTNLELGFYGDDTREVSKLITETLSNGGKQRIINGIVHRLTLSGNVDKLLASGIINAA